MPIDRTLARRLDLISLQLFVAVCECGSLGRAAERAFIAPSAISKRMTDLEALFHTALLERHARGVTPTAAGTGLLHHARAVLLQIDKMHQDLDDYAEGVRGHVRIHASISAIVQFLPEDLGQFARTHAHIKIDLEEHLSVTILQAVKEGAADFGIGHFVAGYAGLQTLPYRQDQLVVVVPRHHPLAAAQQLHLSDTLDFDHIGLHANSSVHQTMWQAAVVAGKPIRLRMRVSGLEAMIRMIANGLGVGIMPQRAFHLLHGNQHDLVAIALQDHWASRQLMLVAPDFAALPQPAKLLVEHLRQLPHTFS